MPANPYEISEDVFKGQIMNLARVRGWRRAHFRPGMMRSGRWVTPMEGEKGFPDLVLVRGPELWLPELKTNRGRTTPDQDIWLEMLGQVTVVRTGVWRPSMWDEIASWLA